MMKWSPLLALGLMASMTNAFAGDANVARSLAATCANCHGTDGRSVPDSGLESLAGASKDQLARKLREFKSGTKPATIMDQIAKGYTDEQLDLIAGYFAARK